MIWDSAEYKAELATASKRFARWRARKRLRSADYVQIEMLAFSAAYIVRKLMDAKKLTKRVGDIRVRVSVAKCIANVTRLNWHKIDELYDFAQSTSKDVSLRFLCNQLIHSYVFVISLNETGGLSSLYFASDEQRNKGLFRLNVRALERTLSAISRDSPKEGDWYYNEATGDFETTTSA